MNFLYPIYRGFHKLYYSLHYCIFHIKKVFYQLSYNGNGNTFTCNGIFFNTDIVLNGHNNTVIIEKGAQLYNMHIAVSGLNNKLIIRKNVLFKESGRIILENENNLIDIGSDTDFVDCFFAIRDYGSNVLIGENCMFSGKITIRNSDGHSILDINGNRINPPRDVIIGNHVWVGYGATILKGSKIGNDSIVGSNSCVSGIFPAGCIIAGNPGRKIKEDINWCRSLIKIKYNGRK